MSYKQSLLIIGRFQNRDNIPNIRVIAAVNHTSPTTSRICMVIVKSSPRIGKGLIGIHAVLVLVFSPGC